MKNIAKQCWCLFLLCFFIASCGYTTKSTLPSRYKTISIKKFKNNISYANESKRNLYLPLLEINTRNAIIDRFMFDGNLKISESDQADMVMTGELVDYSREVLRYDDNDDVQEYRIRVTVSLELWDNKKQEVSWKENLAGEATFFLAGSQATSEETASGEAMTDLARRIVERTIEDW